MNIFPVSISQTARIPSLSLQLLLQLCLCLPHFLLLRFFQAASSLRLYHRMLKYKIVPALIKNNNVTRKKILARCTRLMKGWINMYFKSHGRKKRILRRSLFIYLRTESSGVARLPYIRSRNIVKLSAGIVESVSFAFWPCWPFALCLITLALGIANLFFMLLTNQLILSNIQAYI